MFQKKFCLTFGFFSLNFFLFGFSNPIDWTCDNGQKIDSSWKCDGTMDCDDGSDEAATNCPEIGCGDDYFQCDSGACLPLMEQCDGVFNCLVGDLHDLSDEKNCTKSKTSCNEGEFSCSDGRCLSQYQLCDGIRDCSQAEDEANCQNLDGCLPREVRCNFTTDKACILESYICDGEADCKGGEDERNCNQLEEQMGNSSNPGNCFGPHLLCGDICVPFKKICDGKVDCTSGDDEDLFCNTLTCPSKTNNLVWRFRNFDICDHHCYKSNSKWTCTCFDGYSLEPDSRRCRPTELIVPELFYAADYKINKLILTSEYPKIRKVFAENEETNSEITGLDFSNDSIFWSDFKTGSIHVLQGKKTHKIIGYVFHPRGLSYDWATGNIYIVFEPTAELTGVGVINLQRSLSSTNISEVSPLNNLLLSSPVSIAVNPMTKKMVVIDEGNNNSSRLIRADVDGNSPQVLVHSNEKMFCVAIDYVTNIAYWTEVTSGGKAKIEAIRLEDLQRKTILSNVDQEFTFYSPFSLSTFENIIYFVDKRTRDIWRIDANTGKPLDREDGEFIPYYTASFVHKMTALRIKHPLMQSPQVNPCPRLGCSHACVLHATGARCVCPVRMRLLGTTCRNGNSSEHEIDSSTPATLYTRSESSIPPNAHPCRMPSVELPNVKISSVRRVDNQTTVKFSCRNGWHINGTLYSTSIIFSCSGDGRWNLTNFSCVRFSCSELDCGGGKCITSVELGSVCLCSDDILSFSACPGSFYSNRAIEVTLATLAIVVLIIFIVVFYRKFLRKKSFLSGLRHSLMKEYQETTITSQQSEVSDSQADNQDFKTTNFSFKTLKKSETLHGASSSGKNTILDLSPDSSSRPSIQQTIKTSISGTFKLKKTESQESIIKEND